MRARLIMRFLSDDLLGRILRQASSRRERARFAAVCRRWEALLRAEERLGLRLCFIYSGISLVECGGLGADRRGDALCDVTALLTMRTMPSVAAKLQRAVDTLLLAYRRSFSAARLRSLRFVGYHNLWTLLPPAIERIPVCVLAAFPPLSSTEQLLDVHLCHCSLPTGLGELLGPSVRELRIWDCWPIHRSADAVHSLLEGLRAKSGLETLVWGCDEPLERHASDVDMNPPASLVEVLPAGRLRRLGLSLRDGHEERQPDPQRLADLSQVRRREWHRTSRASGTPRGLL